MSWMQTHSGKRFYPAEVSKSEFCIEDVAHALSNLCRFGGHCNRFYSVAEHSVLVSCIVERNGGTIDEQLWALMHDATEAYMVDVPTPVKALLSGYKDKEHEVMLAIQSALKLPKLRGNKLPRIIKDADGIALVTEALQLVTGDVSEWEASKNFIPVRIKLAGYSPAEARLSFIMRWESLQRRRALQL